MKRGNIWHTGVVVWRLFDEVDERTSQSSQTSEPNLESKSDMLVRLSEVRANPSKGRRSSRVSSEDDEPIIK
jgi:hypothetical protein